MKQLLSIRSQRILSIMSHLIKHPQGAVVTELAVLNNCTVQTVYNYIKYIKKDFNNLIEITNLGNTLSITKYSVGSLLDMKLAFLNESLALKILIEIFLSNQNTIASLSRKLAYSEVHIRTKIKELNVLCEPFEFKIVINKDQTITIDASVPAYYIYFMAIYLKMTRTKLFDESELEGDVSYREAIDATRLPFDIKYYIKDIYDHYLFYYGETQSLKAWIDHILETTPLEAASDLVIRSLNRYKNFELDAYTMNFMKECSIAILLMAVFQPVSIDNFFNRYHIFYEMFTEENRMFVSAYEAVILDIEEKMGVNFSIAKEKLVYHLFVQIENITLRRPLKLCVYSDLGPGHSKVLASSIQSRFLDHSVTPVSSLHDYENYDLIVSTVKHDTIPCSRMAIVNDYITIKDLNAIYEAINSYYQLLLEKEASESH